MLSTEVYGIKKVLKSNEMAAKLLSCWAKMPAYFQKYAYFQEEIKPEYQTQHSLSNFLKQEPTSALESGQFFHLYGRNRGSNSKDYILKRFYLVKMF